MIHSGLDFWLISVSLEFQTAHSSIEPENIGDLSTDKLSLDLAERILEK